MIRSLLAALFVLLLPTMARAACVPGNAPAQSPGCWPQASSLGSSDYLMGWQPGQFPASAVRIPTNLIPGLGILPLTSGGTGASSASGARVSLGAAASGANGDITSLTGLSTPLPLTEGGTGTTSAAAAQAIICPFGSTTATCAEGVKISGVYNAAESGALFNGTDQGAIFQAWLNTLPTDALVEMYGILTTSTTITIPNGVSLACMTGRFSVGGRLSGIQAINDTLSPIVVFDGGSASRGALLRNCDIAHTNGQAAAGVVCLQLLETSDMIIENASIHDCGEGIQHGNGVKADFATKISNTRIFNVTDAYVDIEGGIQVTYLNSDLGLGGTGEPTANEYVKVNGGGTVVPDTIRFFGGNWNSNSTTALSTGILLENFSGSPNGIFLMSGVHVEHLMDPTGVFLKCSGMTAGFPRFSISGGTTITHTGLIDLVDDASCGGELPDLQIGDVLALGFQMTLSGETIHISSAFALPSGSGTFNNVSGDVAGQYGRLVLSGTPSQELVVTATSHNTMSNTMTGTNWSVMTNGNLWVAGIVK